MEVTDIRMRLVADRTDRLKAFCTVTFDEEFVIRDIKVVEGPDGFFIAMPSRKLSAACPGCRHKNQVRARFCEECGKKLKAQPVSQDPAMRTRLYRDIAHPITPAFREKLQTCIIDAYQVECESLPDKEDAETDVDVDRAEDTLERTGSDAEGDSDRGADRPETDRPRDGESDSQGRRPRRRRGPRREASDEQRRDTPAADTEAPAEGVVTEPRDFEHPAPEPIPSEPEPEVTQAPSPAEPEPVVTEAPPPAEREPETVDRVSLDEVEADPASSDDSSGDTETPFGAGIV
ncbi:MAG: septation protein SpoVG family protein [Planctomycetota bacterium]|jgi:stage V sporulation protein G